MLIDDEQPSGQILPRSSGADGRPYSVSVQGVWFALGVALLAGLATGIGGVIIAVGKQPGPKLLAGGLGFSAGVMIFLSFAEMMPAAAEYIGREQPEDAVPWWVYAGFFAGVALIAIIDRLVPMSINPHEPLEPGGMGNGAGIDPALLRTGVMVGLALALHNFPEGFATFVTALEDPRLALPIVIAIALHNIPEGVAVAVPIRVATDSRWKAAGFATLTGLSEPVGAVLGYLLIQPFMTDTIFGLTLATVAGVMVFVSLDKLLPTAEKYGEHHVAIYALIGGMALMALTLAVVQ